MTVFCSASLEFHLVITKLILTKSNGWLSSDSTDQFTHQNLNLTNAPLAQCGPGPGQAAAFANLYQKCYLLNCIVFHLKFYHASYKYVIEFEQEDKSSNQNC